MSTALVAAEISRFLASPDAEVLCIKGKWGVGKTFAWRTYLADAVAADSSALGRYSYVSLFGLNSLEDLRYAIVEGSVLLAQSGTGPTVETMAAFLMEKLGRGQPFFNIALASMGKQAVGAALAKAAYLAVRNQLVCFDDLERAGDGLNALDVLGLASSLKEQRGCKVVLLLNEEEMAEKARKEFDRQLEKVADVSLVFEPTSSEAAAIALPDANSVSEMLRDRINKLGIVNIRVIKKVERLAKRLSDLVRGFSQPIQEQVVSAVTLAGWSVLQPSDAPTLDFLREYNTFTMALRKRQGGDDDQLAEAEKWTARLTNYPYKYADDLDLLVFDGVKRGFFDEAELLRAANIAEQKLTSNPDSNSFSKAFDKFHGSLTANDDEVLDGIYFGAMENLSNISALSMNGTIRLFREMGRGAQADEMLQGFIAAHAEDQAFFNLGNHCFTAGDVIDPALRQAFQDRQSSFTDNRDPRDVLLSITQSSSWSNSDTRLLARMTKEGWVNLFDAVEGRDLPRMIQMAQQLAAQHGEHGDGFRAALTEALQEIAARSPLRAYRLRRFGVSLPPDPAAGPELTED